MSKTALISGITGQDGAYLARSGHVNVGYGSDIEISQLVQIICNIVGYDGRVVYNTAMPDGTPRKLMDSSKLNGMGWRPSVDIEEGIERLYKWFLDSEKSG